MKHVNIEVLTRSICLMCSGRGWLSRIGQEDTPCKCLDESNIAGPGYELDWILIERGDKYKRGESDE
jgi:hypothetical protein